MDNSGNFIANGSIAINAGSVGNAATGLLKINGNYNAGTYLNLYQNNSSWGSGTSYNLQRYILTSSFTSEQFTSFQVGPGGVGIGRNPPAWNDTTISLYVQDGVSITGALSKGSGTFDIPHPNSSNTEQRLVHSFIEGPRCDLIYRGTITLSNGTAHANLDTDCVETIDCAMSPGTFEALCANPVKYLHNNSSFDRVRGSIVGNILTIISENINSDDQIDWMVVAERKDAFIKEWNRTNENGCLVTEYVQ